MEYSVEYYILRLMRSPSPVCFMELVSSKMLLAKTI